MRIQLISVGTKMPDWVETGIEEYTKRLSHAFPLQIKEIPAGKRQKNADIPRILAQEAELILAQVTPQEYCVVLDVQGRSWSTEELAQQLSQWQQSGNNIALVIGGPEGLAPEVYQRANARWSLSKLTFPHPLVRVILAEQLYRAWTILQNHPYHRGG